MKKPNNDMKTSADKLGCGKNESQWIPELDGLRVLMIFVVSCFHIWQQSWLTPHIGSFSLDPILRAGYMPVDGTILLSSFLLFLPYAKHMVYGGELPDIKKFYEKRLCRILPSYNFYILLIICLVTIPSVIYKTPFHCIKDVLTHFTFTFTFFKDTYLQTGIPGGAWTVVIEMQAYLLFPWVARIAVKKPAKVMAAMTAFTFVYRLLALKTLSEYGMVVNQLSNFLDVYAIGMLCAIAYVRLDKILGDRKEKNLESEKARRYSKTIEILWQISATLMIIIAFWGIYRIMRYQAYKPPMGVLQAGQQILRFPLALFTGIVVISLPFAVYPVRKLFGNRAMHFLSTISLNYYLIHQQAAVLIKKWNIIPSIAQEPWKAREVEWQIPYVILCFGVSFAVAVLITYTVEKPLGKLMKKYFQKRSAAIKQA